jgi:hypothetical protein
VKWGLWNVGLHGMVGEQEMEMVKAVMVLERIQVMAVVETMRGREEWRLKREWGEELMRGEGKAEECRNAMGEECVWVEWNRKAFNVRGKRGDGGLGLIVKKECIGTQGGVEIQERDSVEDLMWVEVRGACGVWYVCVMYLRPGKRWEERRDRVWEAYVRGVGKFQGKGRIVVLTDANVRIGETKSQIGGQVYERKSEDKKVGAAGREFVEKSDELKMGILNGLRGKMAKCTSFHRSGVGQSMIDFICVEEGRMGEWGEVERGVFGKGESDHEVVMAKWKGTVRRQGKREQKGGEKSRGEKGGQKIGKLDVSKVRGNRWCKLEERGGMMGEWQEWLWEEGKEEGIDMVDAEWLRKVKVEGGRRESERRVGKRSGECGEGI